MAINIYKPVHTGANNQGGGLNDGFLRVLYHPGISGRVTSEAIKPTASVINKLITKGKNWNFLIEAAELIVYMNQLSAGKF
jgi:hypothetical protein